MAGTIRSASRPPGSDGRRPPRVNAHLTTERAEGKRKAPAHPDLPAPKGPGPRDLWAQLDRADWMRRNGVAFLDAAPGDEDGPYVARQLQREMGDEASRVFEGVGPDEVCIVGDCGDYYDGSCAEFRADGFGCRHGDALIAAGLLAEPTTFRDEPEGQGGERC